MNDPTEIRERYSQIIHNLENSTLSLVEFFQDREITIGKEKAWEEITEEFPQISIFLEEDYCMNLIKERGIKK